MFSILQKKASGYWDFRSGSVLDFSENSNFGSFNSTPLFERNGLVMDGLDDSVTIGATSQTIKTFAIILDPNSTSEDIADMDGGTHTVEVGAGTVTATGWAAPTIYVDGVATSTLVAGISQVLVITSATGFSASALKIGQETTFFAGIISAAFISNDELTATEVSQLTSELLQKKWPQKAFSKVRTNATPPIALGAEASWVLKPVEGGVADLIAGNTGDINGQLYYKRAILGDSMVFPGFVGSNIQVPDSDVIDITTGDFTLTFWVKTTSGNPSRIFDKRGGIFPANPGYTIGINAGGQIMGGIGDGTNSIPEVTVLNNGAINDGLWHFVVCRFDRSGLLTCIVDAVSGNNTDISFVSSSLANASDLFIGVKAFGGVEPFDGELAYPTLFKKVLDSNEFNYLYELGARAVPFKTDWGVKQSVANVTSGQIENSVFNRSTGTWKIGVGLIGQEQVKFIENIAAGVAYADISGDSSPTEAAYGEWTWSVFKGADANTTTVQFIADVIGANNAAGQDGYDLTIDANEALSLQRSVNGAVTTIYKTNDSFITNSQWYKVRVTRNFQNRFTIYIDGNLAQPTGAIGTNPITDTSTTEGRYFNFDLDASDLIAYSSLRGDSGIRTKVMLSLGGGSA